MDSRHLNMFGIMANIMPDINSDNMEREIFLYSRNKCDFGKTLNDFLQCMRDSELLQCHSEAGETLENGGQWAAFKLNNTSVSRKKFEIVFREYYV